MLAIIIENTGAHIWGANVKITFYTVRSMFPVTKVWKATSVQTSWPTLEPGNHFLRAALLGEVGCIVIMNV